MTGSEFLQFEVVRTIAASLICGATVLLGRSHLGTLRDFAHCSAFRRERAMPRGDKSKYTDKQERKADHIAESYENRGVPEQEAERRAWATVNKDDGGGERPGGSGRGKSTGHPAAHKGGRKGGAAAASRSPASRSESAKKAAATRKRNAARRAQG
jgi:plasmid stabilization system protein ParE